MSNDIFKLIKGSALFRRFLVLFTILATVPVLVLGTVSLYLTDKAHKQDVSALELQLIGQKTEEIDKFFVDTLGTMELTVDVPQDQISPDQLQFILRGILDSNQSFRSIRFAGPDGRIAAYRDSERELAPVGNLFDAPAFQAASGGRLYIGEIYYYEEEPMVQLAAPVRKKDPVTNTSGDVIGVLVADVALTRIAGSIEGATLGNEGYLILADNKGRLVAHGSNSGFEAGADISHIKRVQDVVSGKSFNALGEGDRYSSFFSDVEVVGAAEPVPPAGWALMAEWPLSDADAILSDIRYRVFQVAALALLAVILIAPFFVARLVRPIKKLRAAAEEIEKGKFDTRVDIKTRDELEELGSTFNKMATGLKRLQELKDEFVFVAAHELRTPVTAIKGYLSLILEGSAGQISARSRKFLEQTQRSNERLNQLVEDLLEIARSEAGRLEINVSPVDAESTVKSTIDELRPLADEKQITISYSPLEVMPKVLADANRIKEVLVNLVGNAIKYTQKQGSVEVFHEQRDGMLVTHIKDNGFGISEEAQKNLFQKFYRVQTDKTKNVAGTGLGLFIVKQIVEKMGGRIWVVSEEGKGSTFSFSLPLAGAYDS